MVAATFACGPLAADLSAQDTTHISEHLLIDQLLEHRILSEHGARTSRSWVDFKNTLPAPTGEAAQEASLGHHLIHELGLAAGAYRRLAWIAYLSDSLKRAGALPDTSAHSRKNDRVRSNAIHLLGEQRDDRSFPPRRSSDPVALKIATHYPEVGSDIRNQQFFIAKVDTSIFQRYASVTELTAELLGAGLLDSLLHAEVMESIRCGAIQDGCALLEQLQQELRSRDWRLSSRRTELARVAALVDKGYMDPDAARRMIDALGPYDAPDNFHIAVRSSPHSIVACKGVERTVDEFYRAVLTGLDGLVPELHPTDMRIARSSADTTLSSATHVTEVSFVNGGHRYSFVDYEGHRGEGLKKPSAQGCYGPFSLLSPLNKALSDAGSPYRLKYFEDHEGNCGDFTVTRQALVFLDEERCALWWPAEKRNTDALGRPSEQKPFDRCAELFSKEFSRDSIASMVRQLGTLDLLQHLDAAAIENSTERVNERTLYQWDRMLSAFPGLIAYPEVHRFPERDGEVTKRLEELAGIAHGRVKITEVKEKWVRSEYYRWRVKLSFKVNDQLVRIERVIMTQRLDDEFVTRINHALMQQGVNGRFAAIRSDREVAVLFVDRAQYDALKGKLIMPWYGDIWHPDLSTFDR